MTRRGVIMIAAFAAWTEHSGAQPRFALPERRGIAAFEERVLPGLRQEVNEAAGFEVPIEIDWPNVVVEPLIGQGERFTEPEFFTDIYFRPLIAALKTVARDPMGRDALKGGLKSVVIRYKPWEEWPVFADGVLTLQWRAWSNPGDVEARTRQIVEALERGL